MAKTRYDKAWEILGSALSDQNASVYQTQREQEEAEFRRQQQAEEERLRREELERLRSEELLRAEGRARAPRLDQLGTLEGMTEALKRPSAPPKEEGLKTDLINVAKSARAQDTLNEAYDIHDQLGDLETKYRTPEQRAEARARLQKQRDLAMMDRSTFEQASAAARELNRIDEAEELFSDPRKVEELKARMAQLKAAGQVESQEAENYFDRTNSWVARTGADVWNSRASLLAPAAALAGGALFTPLGMGPVGAGAGAVTGSIPAAEQARKAAYSEGRDAGMSEDQAREFSHVMAASDFVLSAVGQGGVAALSGILKTEAKKRITDSMAKHVLKTSIKQGALGYAEEAGTQALQMGIRADYAQDSDLSQATRDYLRQTANIKQDGTIDWGSALSEMNRAGLAGVATTAAVATPVEIITTSAEMGRQAKILDDQIKGRIDARTVRNEFRAAQERNLARNNVEQGELFDLAPDNTPSFEEQEASRQREYEIDAGIQLGRRQSEQDRQAANRETNREELAAPLQRRAEELRGQLEQVDDLLAEGDYSQGTLNSRTALQQELAQVESQISSIVDVVSPQAPRLRSTTVSSRVTPELPNSEPTQQALPFPRVANQPKRAPVAPQVTATETPAVPAQEVTPYPTTVTEEATTVPVSTITEALQNAPTARTALPSTGTTNPNPSTLEDVRSALQSEGRSSTTSRLSYMLQDGNLDIVQDQSEIPGGIGKMQQQGKGWYDPETGKLYLVTSNLDKNNIKGEILATLAHETKHGADFGGSAKLAGSFVNFVGAEANKRMVAQIKQAAAKGNDPSAVNAMAVIQNAYEGQGYSGDQMSSEIVAAYISQEARKSGVKTSLYRSIVSPIRQGARQLLGSKNVSLGDIHYVADQLVGQVAQRGERLEPSFGGIALPMFAGRNAKTAPLGNKLEAEKRLAAGEDPELVRRETGWHIGVDGHPRFEFSDHEAEVTPAFKRMQPGAKRMLLKDVIKHDKLFEAYPWLRLISVTREAGSSPTIQGWVGGKDGLELNITPTATNIEETILHEIQHLVQGYEGWAPGGSQSTVYQSMSPEQRATELPKVLAAIEEKAVRAIKNAEAFDALSLLPKSTIARLTADRQRERDMYTQIDKVRKAGYDFGTPEFNAVYQSWVDFGDRLEKAKEDALVEVGLDPKDATSKSTINQVINGENPTTARNSWNLIALKEQNRKAAIESGDEAATVQALQEANVLYKFYQRLAGEVEARTTGYRRSMTPEQRQTVSPAETLANEYGEVAPGDEIIIPRESSNSEQEASRQTSRALPSLVDNSVPPRDLRTWREKAKDKSAIFRVLNSLVSTTDNLGMGLFRLQDARQGLRGDLSLRAEKLGHRMENGVAEVAKSRKTTIDKVYKELEAKLASINKEPDRDVRQSMVKDLDKDFPGVGTALNEIRELKWALARNLLEQRAAQGTDLTAKESNIYAAIVSNAETYTTRAYTGTQIPSKRIAKQRLRNIKKDPTGESATKYNEAISYLVDNHLLIPSKDTMLDMKRGAVARIYENYKGDASGKSVETMANELDLIPRANKEALQLQAVAIAEELMGLKSPKTTIARGYKGQRQNRTILEGREDVPDPIRFLMGEITNPVAAELMTVARLINLYSQTKLLQSIKDQGADKWYKEYKEGDFNLQLTAEEYGPLKGMYVTPSVAQYLEPAVSIGLDLEQAFNDPSGKLAEWAGIVLDKTVSGTRALTGAVKMADLVTSPAAMVWNYIGAYGIALQNGVVNPASLAKAQYLTLHAINAHYNNDSTLTKRLSKEDQTAIQEIIRARVLDSATVGEFQQSMYQGIFKILQEVEGGDVSILNKTKELMSGGASVARDMYAFMDMWAKVAAFRDRKAMLTEFYKAKDPTVTAEAIIREAGETVNSTNISYTRALGLVKKLERNVPMLTMYLTYFSEVPRSVVMSYAQSIKDIRRGYAETNPQARAVIIGAGIRRFVGTATLNGVLVGAVNYYLGQLEDDEERRRETDPEWEKNGVPVVVGKTSDGKAITVNVLRLDPNGPLTEFLVRALRAEKEDERLDDVLIETFKSQFVQAKPVMNTFRLLMGMAGKETVNFDDDYGMVADYLDDLGGEHDPNLGRNLMSVLEGFTPKIIKGTYRSLKGTLGNRSYEFDPATERDVAALQALGFSLNVRDPEFSLELAASNYKKLKKSGNEAARDILDRAGRRSGAEIVERLSKVIAREEDAYQDLWKVYDGTKAFNGYYTDKDYSQAAKGILKSKEVGDAAKDLENNSFNIRFIPRDFSKKYFAARQGYIRGLEDPKKKSELSAQLRNDKKILDEYLANRSK